MRVPFLLYSVLLLAQLCCSVLGQSCLNGSKPGWFWDGQKCEVCSDESSICTSANTTDSCTASSLRIVDSIWKNGRCVACPSYTLECSSPFNVTDYGEWLDDFHSKALISDKCFANSEIQSYLHFGSVCFMEPNCVSYTQVGRCKACRSDGYTVDNNQKCEQCQVNKCKSCIEPENCQQCLDGYYLATSETDPDAILDSNLCKQCPDNCACNKRLPNNEYEDLRAKDSSWFMGLDKKCYSCNDTARGGIEGCINCTFSQNKVICNRCASSSGAVYHENPVQQGSSCVKCPENCLSCNLTSAGQPSCYPDKCEPGFRAVQQVGSEKYTCQACSKPNNVPSVLCRTVNNLEELTECNPGQRIPHSMFTQGDTLNLKDYYYLVRLADQSLTCVKNINSCRKIVDNLTDVGDPSCASCYESLQFLEATNSTHAECKLKLPNCKSQVQSNVCDVCEQSETVSYFINTTKMCQLCPNCSKCDDFGVCLNGTCNPGFRQALDADNNTICTACSIQNCLRCSSDGKNCLECMKGFRLQEPLNNSILTIEQCEACEWGCKKCTSNRKKCDLCFGHQDGAQWAGQGQFYLSGESCSQFTYKCLKHYKTQDIQYYSLNKTELNCQICETGYRPIKDKCLKCYDRDVGFVHCPFTRNSTPTLWMGDIMEEKDYKRISKEFDNGSPILGSLTILCSLLLALFHL